VFLSQTKCTNTRTETFAPLIYAVIDYALLQATRQTWSMLLLFINVITFRLVEAAAYLPKFCSQLGSDLDCWEPVVLWNESGCPHSRRLIVSQARCACRSTVLLEDKELARDLTHDRQNLVSQQHVTALLH